MKEYENYIVEFDEITYDRKKLEEFYNKFEKLGCVQTFSDYNFWLKGGEYREFVIWNNMKALNVELATPETKLINQPEIKEILNQLNIELHDNDVDFVIYDPGFIFNPHIDHYMQCGIMLPVLPVENYSPIEFYELPGYNCVPRRHYAEEVAQHGYTAYTHYYSHLHPTMFNGTKLHGVPMTDVPRMYLRIKIVNESFESIRERARTKNLFN